MSIAVHGRRIDRPAPDHDTTRPRPPAPRLLVASNRLPVRLSLEGAHGARVVRSDGGLVTALGPLVRARSGVWIGWAGVPTDGEDGTAEERARALEEFDASTGFASREVPLTTLDVKEYYGGFCNRVLWPLFHGFVPSRPIPDACWRAYQRVNVRFADAIVEEVEPDDQILVNDYHLLLVPGLLRERGISNRLACFIHTPFPPGDLFDRLPWSSVLMDSLLESDRLGFQTVRDRRNFRDALGDRFVASDASGAFPISVDVDEFASTATSGAVVDRAESIREEIDTSHLVLGVDRLDYTKGIPEKLYAFEALLEEREDLHHDICLVQLVVPSRTSVPEYRELRERIERKVAQINGRFTANGWIPVHYRFGRWDREELVAHYRAADIALVTPVRDGMNLVAKEFCVSQPSEDPGVLVLSEFAGAARELDEALLVNPHDTTALARMIGRAIEMPLDERRGRMSALATRVRENDVHAWARRLLDEGSRRPTSTRRVPRLGTRSLLGDARDVPRSGSREPAR